MHLLSDQMGRMGRLHFERAVRGPEVDTIFDAGASTFIDLITISHAGGLQRLSSLTISADSGPEILRAGHFPCESSQTSLESLKAAIAGPRRNAPTAQYTNVRRRHSVCNAFDTVNLLHPASMTRSCTPAHQASSYFRKLAFDFSLSQD